MPNILTRLAQYRRTRDPVVLGGRLAEWAIRLPSQKPYWDRDACVRVLENEAIRLSRNANVEEDVVLKHCIEDEVSILTRIIEHVKLLNKPTRESQEYMSKLGYGPWSDNA